MKTTSERQWNCLKNWAKTCQDCFRRSGHIPLLTKIPTENEGFTLSGTPATDVSKNEVDEWDNFLNNLIDDGFIKFAGYQGNQTKYRFTSMTVVEQILAF